MPTDTPVDELTQRTRALAEEPVNAARKEADSWAVEPPFIITLPVVEIT
jgi:hypothetical protein